MECISLGLLDLYLWSCWTCWACIFGIVGLVSRSFNNLKLVYHALIKSRLQYGIVLWGNANQSALKNFNKMHNRAIRYISIQPYRIRLNKLYALSKLLKVNELYQYSAMKFIF